jgi:MFS family permease
MLGTAQGPSVPWLLVGVVLFGLGIGNATSLPPLMVQAEFHPQDTARMVALVTATAQATYSFAPLVFGLVRSATGARPADGLATGSGIALFAVAAGIQLIAAACCLLGRGRFEKRGVR